METKLVRSGTYTNSLILELKECSTARNLERGKELHAEAIERGRDSNVYVASALINMYTKCGSMVDAHEVFGIMQHPTVVSWTVLILGYAENGQCLTALDLFRRMRGEGLAPDSVAFVAVLKACSSLAVKKGPCDPGKGIHNLAVEHGCDLDIKVQNTLIDMYAKGASMLEARQVFDSMSHPSVVSWTVLILGYAENGRGKTALELFRRMKHEGPVPSSLTLVAALKACASLVLEDRKFAEWRKLGSELHKLAEQYGWDSEIKVQNTLIDMYAKCRDMVNARQVFNSIKHPDVVSWTVLILGYAECSQGLSALECFRRMIIGGLAPNSVTLVAALKACTALAVEGGPSEWGECRERGRAVHDLAVANGLHSNLFVQNTLIDMYAKCGSMVDSREVFDSMEHRDLVSWTALILGYAETGQGVAAFDLFKMSRSVGVAPDSVMYSAALKACGLVGGLAFGKTIHAEIDRAQELDVFLVTSVVDFYLKCGSLMEARSMFDAHAEARDTVTWTALLAGFSICGDHESVFELFQQMQDAGVRPDAITFQCILACCSHAGLVHEGKECFDVMSTKYGITGTVEHYNCMLDILGRAKRIDDAMGLLQGIPCSPNGVTWMTMLGACRKWQNVELGKLVFQALVAFSGSDSAAYVLMGQIYASKGMFKEQKMVIEMRPKLLRGWKPPGVAFWTDEVGEVYLFSR